MRRARSAWQRRLTVVAGTLVAMLIVVGVVLLVLKGGDHPNHHKSHEDGFVGDFCPNVPTNSQDRRKDKATLRIATFNTEWLFLGGGKGSAVRCPSPQCPWSDVLAARQHMAKVAALLDRLDADIVALQEVEDCRTLAEMAALLDERAAYRPYVVEGKDVALGQNVAMLSRVDPHRLWRTNKQTTIPVAGSSCPAIMDVAAVEGKTKSGCTKHLISEFAGLMDKPLLVVVVHLMADPSDAAKCRQREAQAQTLITELAAFKRSHHIVLVGDFNDHDGEVQARLGRPPPMSSVLARLKQRLELQSAVVEGIRRFPPPPGSGDYWFTNRHLRQPHLIDHALVSAPLVSRLRSVQIAHHNDRLVSDHSAIVLDLQC